MAKKPEEPQEEKTYEVKDKRRVNADGTLKEPDQPAEKPSEAEAPQEPEKKEAEAGEGQEKERVELPVPDVYGVLGLALNMLSEQAWRYMGLVLMPGKKELEKDLKQAKMAIDTIVFIADKLHPHISEDERRALRELVSNLQLNFVQQSK